MNLIRLYMRVLKQLGPESRLGIVLALANVLLAIAQFAEPVLFGRIIDLLSKAQATGIPPKWADLATLASAWVAFGLFTIGGGVTVALHADRLAHRRRLAIMAGFFEHVLTLPLSFHATTHSGRVLKVMLDGAAGMQGLLLSFFREHFSSFVALVVLLPLTLFINWQLGLLLVVLLLLFTVLTAMVLRKTETMQGSVELFHSSLAAHASDALGNVPVIQSFTRIEHGGTRMQGHHRPAPRRPDPGAVLVGAGGRRDARLGHAHHPRDFPARHLAEPARPGHRRRDRRLHEPRHDADRPDGAGRRAS